MMEGGAGSLPESFLARLLFEEAKPTKTALKGAPKERTQGVELLI